MKKAEFMEAVAQRAEVSKEEAQRYFDAFEETIVETLGRGDEVQLTGFGKFYVQERDAREGINPQTKEKMHIPASKVPKFSPGNGFKKAV